MPRAGLERLPAGSRRPRAVSCCDAIVATLLSRKSGPRVVQLLDPTGVASRGITDGTVRSGARPGAGARRHSEALLLAARAGTGQFRLLQDDDLDVTGRAQQGEPNVFGVAVQAKVDGTRPHAQVADREVLDEWGKHRMPEDHAGFGALDREAEHGAEEAERGRGRPRLG